MWYVIPVIILVLSLIVYFIGRIRSREDFGSNGWNVRVVILWGALLFAIPICSIQYYQSRVDALVAEQYYASFIVPNKLSEDATTVNVSGQVAGIWQAGEYNAVGYNRYLVNNRYWIKIPIINTVIYPAPDYLKYVVVK